MTVIATSQGQTQGQIENLGAPDSLNISGISVMTQTATNATAVGANLLKLNQQAVSATQGRLPNASLAIEPGLDMASQGLDAVFAQPGAQVTAQQFFQARRVTQERTRAAVKMVQDSLASGGRASVTSISRLTQPVTNRMTGFYVPGSGTVLNQTGAVNEIASRDLSATVGQLRESGVITGIAQATQAADNTQGTLAVSALSQASKIPAPGVAGVLSLPAIPTIAAQTGLPGGIPAVDAQQIQAAAQAIAAAQNPENPLATTGATVGATDRSKIDQLLRTVLPPMVPTFNAGTATATELAVSALSSARFKNVRDADLVYRGTDARIWDEINNERLRRGLAALTTPRPADASDYVRRYSNPAYSGG